jgi:hypothetical protein
MFLKKAHKMRMFDLRNSHFLQRGRLFGWRPIFVFFAEPGMAAFQADFVAGDPHPGHVGANIENAAIRVGHRPKGRWRGFGRIWTSVPVYYANDGFPYKRSFRKQEAVIVQSSQAGKLMVPECRQAVSI